MNELTPELLGLVLDELIPSISEMENNEIYYLNKRAYTKSINVDTLTRLMKEWCLKNVNVVSSSHLSIPEIRDGKPFYQCQVYISSKETSFTSNISEFEAVLKASHWVAKEKGLVE